MKKILSMKIVIAVFAVGLSFTISFTPGFAQKTFDFEVEDVSDKNIQKLAMQAGIAENRINNYLTESREDARAGLEQAFRDFRVWFRKYNHREEIAIVRAIKQMISQVFNVFSVIVPTTGAFQKLFKAMVVVPAIAEMTKEEPEYRFSGIEGFLDLLEQKYGEYVLMEGLQVYDKFKQSPEYDGTVDIFMENFEENTLGGEGGLPPDVAGVLSAEGVPPPGDGTEQRFRECALLKLIAHTLRDVTVPTGGAGRMLIWDFAGFGSPEGLAGNVIGTTIMPDIGPFGTCR